MYHSTGGILKINKLARALTTKEPLATLGDKTFPTRPVAHVAPRRSEKGADILNLNSLFNLRDPHPLSGEGLHPTADRYNMSGGSDNVCVAVRLRPFNSRERARGAKCCITVDGNSCTLTHPTGDPNQGRHFAFDHVFDSFTEDVDNVATQKTVWEAVGVPVLEAAWGGYNGKVAGLLNT